MFEEPEKINRVAEERFKQLRRNEHTEADEEGIVNIEGKRYNIMGAEYFMARILEMMEEIYGQGAGGIIEDAGRDYGRNLVSEEFEDPCREIGSVIGHLKYLGYGNIEFREDKVVMDASPTAEEYSGESDRSCYFISGVLTSIIRETIDEDVRLTEDRCRSDADDKCVFSP